MDLEECVEESEKYLKNDFEIIQDKDSFNKKLTESNEILQRFFSLYLYGIQKNLDLFNSLPVLKKIEMSELYSIKEAAEICIEEYGNFHRKRCSFNGLVKPNSNINIKNRNLIIFGKLFESFNIERRLLRGEYAVDYTKSLIQQMYLFADKKISESPFQINKETSNVLSIKSSKKVVLPERYRKNYLEKPSLKEKFIIGNEGILDFINKNTDKLLFYDSEKKYNKSKDKGLTNVILLYGPPGEGKGLIVNHALLYAYEKAEAIGKKIIYNSISNFLKTEYQNSFLTNIKPMLEDIKKGNDIYFITIDEAESTLFKKDSSRINTEENKNVSEIMKFIEGENNSYLGNYVIILSTNYPEAMETAMFDRCQTKIYVGGIQTVEQYKEYLQRKLKETIDAGLININDWNSLSTLAKNKNLSGRGCRDLCRKIVSMSYDTYYPNEYYKDSNSNLDDLAKKINQKDIEHIINSM